MDHLTGVMPFLITAAHDLLLGAQTFDPAEKQRIEKEEIHKLKEIAPISSMDPNEFWSPVPQTTKSKTPFSIPETQEKVSQPLTKKGSKENKKVR